MKTLDPPDALDTDPSSENREVLIAVPNQEPRRCCGKAT
jgi:hypothetical protein